MRTCVRMFACVVIPRFELVVAAGGREALMGRPAALAPEAGREAVVGEVSAAAEAFGVRPGLRLGEALARCPELTLVPPDPAGTAEAWEALLARLEGIGAAVSPERPGLVAFDARGLRGIHGGSLEGVVAAAQRALPAVGARIAAAPSPFCALAAAAGARPRRPKLVRGGEAEARSYLAPLPVALLRARGRTAELPEALERLGVATLGELAELPAAKLADRFGRAGILARELALGRDEPLRPRRTGERLHVALDLPEAASGPQLERALELLVDRLLARSERRGRSLRAVVLSAALVEGGTWRERVVFREALADPLRMRLALAPRLALLPAPAESLRLAAERFGPPTGDQRRLLQDGASVRAARLREAVRQARAAAGPDAALRVLTVDPDSRVPERRTLLAPFEP
jgi:nucleotidyltransferase/DNA polymerase involved in DNA repair